MAKSLDWGKDGGGSAPFTTSGFPKLGGIDEQSEEALREQRNRDAIAGQAALMRQEAGVDEHGLPLDPYERSVALAPPEVRQSYILHNTPVDSQEHKTAASQAFVRGTTMRGNDAPDDHLMSPHEVRQAALKKGGKGFWATVADEFSTAAKVAKKVPLLGSVLELEENRAWNEIEKRLSDPDHSYRHGRYDPAYAEDMRLLTQRENERAVTAERERGHEAWAMGGKIAAEMPTFALEMGLTGEMGGALPGRLGKIMRTFGNMSKVASRSKGVAWAAQRVGHALVYSAMQASLMPTRTAEAYQRHHADKFAVTQDELGRLGVILERSGDSAAIAAYKAWADTFKEVLSEHTGEAFGWAAGKLISKIPMPKSVANVLLGVIGEKDAGGAFSRILGDMSVQPAFEGLEERIGGAMEVLLGIDEHEDGESYGSRLWHGFWPGFEQIKAEAIGFAPSMLLGAGGAVAGHAMERGRVRSERRKLEKLPTYQVLPPEVKGTIRRARNIEELSSAMDGATEWLLEHASDGSIAQAIDKTQEQARKNGEADRKEQDEEIGRRAERLANAISENADEGRQGAENAAEEAGMGREEDFGEDEVDTFPEGMSEAIDREFAEGVEGRGSGVEGQGAAGAAGVADATGAAPTSTEPTATAPREVVEQRLSETEAELERLRQGEPAETEDAPTAAVEAAAAQAEAAAGGPPAAPQGDQAPPLGDQVGDQAPAAGHPPTKAPEYIDGRRGIAIRSADGNYDGFSDEWVVDQAKMRWPKRPTMWRGKSPEELRRILAENDRRSEGRKGQAIPNPATGLDSGMFPVLSSLLGGRKTTEPIYYPSKSAMEKVRAKAPGYTGRNDPGTNWDGFDPGRLAPFGGMFRPSNDPSKWASWDGWFADHGLGYMFDPETGDVADEPSVFWEKLYSEVKTYREMKAHEDDMRKAAGRQSRFEKDAVRREGAPDTVNVSDLGVGDKVNVRGEPVEVSEVDADSGVVTLDDGDRYGRDIKVEDGRQLQVDAVVTRAEAEAAKRDGVPDAAELLSMTFDEMKKQARREGVKKGSVKRAGNKIDLLRVIRLNRERKGIAQPTEDGAAEFEFGDEAVAPPAAVAPQAASAPVAAADNAPAPREEAEEPFALQGQTPEEMQSDFEARQAREKAEAEQKRKEAEAEARKKKQAEAMSDMYQGRLAIGNEQMSLFAPQQRIEKPKPVETPAETSQDGAAWVRELDAGQIIELKDANGYGITIEHRTYAGKNKLVPEQAYVMHYEQRPGPLGLISIPSRSVAGADRIEAEIRRILEMGGRVLGTKERKGTAPQAKAQAEGNRYDTMSKEELQAEARARGLRPKDFPDGTWSKPQKLRQELRKRDAEQAGTPESRNAGTPETAAEKAARTKAESEEVRRAKNSAQEGERWWEKTAAFRRGLEESRNGGESTHVINTPERRALRLKIAEEYYEGAKQKGIDQGHEFHIVMGLPGAGKSSAVVRNIRKRIRAIEIDADEVKPKLPGFDDGAGAGRVHKESADIAERAVMLPAMDNGDNIIFPTIGKNADKLLGLIRKAKEKGYKVYLYNVDIPLDESIARALTRYVETGRFVSPEYIFDEVGLHPKETFDRVTAQGVIDGYVEVSNDVPRGQPPRYVRGDRALAEGRVAGRGLEAGDGYGRERTGLDEDRPGAGRGGASAGPSPDNAGNSGNLVPDSGANVTTQQQGEENHADNLRGRRDEASGGPGREATGTGGGGDLGDGEGGLSAHGPELDGEGRPRTREEQPKNAPAGGNGMGEVAGGAGDGQDLGGAAGAQVDERGAGGDGGGAVGGGRRGGNRGGKRGGGVSESGTGVVLGEGAVGDAGGARPRDAAVSSEGRGGERAAGSGAPGERAQAQRRNADNHVITDPDYLDAGGAKAKYRDNLAALRVLKTLREEGREATPEEREIIAKYVGWGRSEFRNGLFAYYGGEWEKERKELREVIGEDEFESARRSTLTAFWTPPRMAQSVWGALERLGFKGGRVHEPSVGNGVFFGTMPIAVRDRSVLSGADKDVLASEIAKQLYPGARITSDAYQEAALPDDFYDLVIGNFPFADITIRRDKYNKVSANLHDYFWLKSLGIVRPGGLVAAITSTGTMDKMNDAVRREIADKADVVAAVRLPEGTFSGVAGTDVVTDLIILRKREPGQEMSEDTRAWLETVECNKVSKGDEWLPGVINQYYEQHPDHILGKLTSTHNQYGHATTVRLAKGENLQKRLDGILAGLPEGLYTPRTRAVAAPKTASAAELGIEEGTLRDGSLVAKDGEIWENTPQGLVQVNAPQHQKKKAAMLIGLRDTLNALRTAETTDGSDAQLKSLRKELNRRYDEFVRTYGPLNKKGMLGLMDGDPSSHMLLALERSYDKDKNKATKADIFTTRVGYAKSRATHAENYEQAAGFSMNETGHLDAARVGEMMGVDTETAERELMGKGLAYRAPDGALVGADEYLSGNVRDKLRQAEAAARLDPAFRPNVDALRKVLPADKGPGDITVNLGATWVPPDVMTAFASHVLGIPDTEDGLRFEYNHALGRWVVTLPENRWMARRIEDSAAFTNTYATQHRSFLDILDAALHDTRIRITRKDPYTGQSEVLTVESEEANTKAEKLKDEFLAWLWQDKERTKTLTRIYNDTFNGFVERKKGGRWLSFPGMTPSIKPRPHQVAAVEKLFAARRLLMAHEVGTGKTITYGLMAEKAKETGIASKPLLVVKNSTVRQVAAEIQRLFPGMNIFVGGESMTAAKRKRSMAQIANNNWDLVILTHDNLGSLDTDPAIEGKFIEGQIRELRAAADAVMQSAMQKKDRDRIRKNLLKRIESLRERLTGLLRSKKTDGVSTFQDLGFDMVMVDECQAFKKLPIATYRDRVKGIPVEGSKRASALLMNVQNLLENNPEACVVFGSGTPLDNSLVEAYVWQRYLQNDLLKEAGITSFDAWASNFGRTTADLEMSPSGGDWKEVERFKEFVNLGELSAMMRQNMDVVFASDTGEIVRPNRHDSVDNSPETDVSREIIQDLEARAKAIKERRGKPKPGDDNMLVVCGDGRKAAVHPGLYREKYVGAKGTKADACIDRVAKNHKADPKAAQMIFCDCGVNDTPWGFNLYKYLRDGLVKAGFKPEQVAFFSSNLSPALRAALAEKMNNGEILVAIGSTDTMGTGINAQKRLRWMHHLDASRMMTPGSIEQRNGRGHRQGNTYKDVEVVTYVQTHSLDVFTWNLIKNKAGFINSFLRGENLGTIEEESDTISPDQIVAISSGDPRVFRKAKVEKQLHRLHLQEAAFEQSKRDQEGDRRAAQWQLGRLDDEIKDLRTAVDAADKTTGKPFKAEVVGAGLIRPSTHTERDAALSSALDAAVVAVSTPLKEKIDNDGFSKLETVARYRGFEIQVRWEGAKGNSRLRYVLKLPEDAETTYAFSPNFDTNDKSTMMLAVFRSADATISGLKRRLASAIEDRETTARRIEDLSAGLDRKFESAEKITALELELQRLNDDLSGKNKKEGENGEPAAAPKPDGTVKYSRSGLFTGSAADYAHRREDGTIENGPSLHKVGTGEGAQAYGWGLYASDRRGVAEGYAGRAVMDVSNFVYKLEDMPDCDWNMANRVGAAYQDAGTKDFEKIVRYLRETKGAHSTADWMEKHRSDVERLAEETLEKSHVYEQTLFTNRATPEETERHLLKWYGKVTKRQADWIKAQAEKEGVRVPYLDGGIQGAMLYNYLASPSYLGSPRAASEFLARAGIDGVKYPVDSYGKPIKDGDKAGWNYVSFRDDNIRVDHKWRDGKMEYQRVGEEASGGGRERLEGAARALEKSLGVSVEISADMPDWAREQSRGETGDIRAAIDMKTGRVWLSEAIANEGSAAHEGAHWVDALTREAAASGDPAAKAAAAKFAEIVSHCPESLRKRIEKAYGEVTDSEIFAHMVEEERNGNLGKMLAGEKPTTRTWWQRVKRAFALIWQALRRMFGAPLKASALGKMDWRDALHQMSEAMRTGQRIEVGGKGTGGGGVRRSLESPGRLDTLEKVEKAARGLDGANGTELATVVRLVGAIGAGARGEVAKLSGRHFRFARTNDILVESGLTGEYFTIRAGVILRHEGKDAGHAITPAEWIAISDALSSKKPLLVEKYKGADNSFRIWTQATIGGKTAIVGAVVKNAGKNIDVNSIQTVFGVGGAQPKIENVVYPKTETEIRSVLIRHNSGRYTISPKSSDGSLVQSSDGSNEIIAPNSSQNSSAPRNLAPLDHLDQLGEGSPRRPGTVQFSRTLPEESETPEEKAAVEEAAEENREKEGRSGRRAFVVRDGVREYQDAELVKTGGWFDATVAEGRKAKDGSKRWSIVGKDGKTYVSGMKTEEDAKWALNQKRAEVAATLDMLRASKARIGKVAEARRELIESLGKLRNDAKGAAKALHEFMDRVGIPKDLQAKEAKFVTEMIGAKSPWALDRRTAQAQRFADTVLARMAIRRSRAEVEKLLKKHSGEARNPGEVLRDEAAGMRAARAAAMDSRSADEIDRRCEEILNRIGAIDNELADMDLGTTPDERRRATLARESRGLYEEWNALRNVGGLFRLHDPDRARGTDGLQAGDYVADLEAWDKAKKWLKELAQKAGRERRAMEEEKKAEADEIRRQAVKELLGEEGQITDVNLLKAKNSRLGRKVLNALLWFKMGIDGGLALGEQLVYDKNVGFGDGIVYKMIREAAECEDAEKARNEETDERVGKMLADYFGVDVENGGREQQAEYMRRMADLKRQRKTNVKRRILVVDDETGEGHVEVAKDAQGREETFDNSLAELMPLVLWRRQAEAAAGCLYRDFVEALQLPKDERGANLKFDGRPVEDRRFGMMMGLVNSGFLPETIDEAEDLLRKEGVLDLADRMSQEFDHSYDEMDEMCRWMYGSSMEKVDSYCPAKREYWRQAGPKGVPGMEGFMGMMASFIRARTDNRRAFELYDLFDRMVRDGRQKNHMLTHYRLVDKARRVFSHPEMQKALVQKLGESAKKHVDAYWNTIARGQEDWEGTAYQILRNIGGRFAAAQCARWSVMLKQMTSPSAAMSMMPEDMTMGEWFKWFANLHANPKEAANYLRLMRKHIPNWRYRIKGNIDQAMEMAMQATNLEGTKLGVVKKSLNWLQRLGMLPTRFGDAYGCVAGTYPIWKHQVRKYEAGGMSQQEAMRRAFQDVSRAYNETQQSTLAAYLGHVQTSHLMVWGMMFKSSPIQLSRMAWTHLRALKMGRGSRRSHVRALVGLFAAQALYALAGGSIFAWGAGKGDDDDERRIVKWAKAAGQAAANLLLNGYPGGSIGSELLDRALSGDWRTDQALVDANAPLETLSEIPRLAAEFAREDGPRGERVGRSTANLVGAGLGVPLPGVWAWGTGLYDARYGDDLTGFQRLGRSLGYSRQAVGAH